VLHIHRAERADGLVQALRTLLVQSLDDPFAPEVIAVPTRGMERWLTQRMSACLGATPGFSDGVCANVEFPFPRRLVEDAVAAASGVNTEDDPWPPERAVWPLLVLVGDCIEEPWLRSLAVHLGNTPDSSDEIREARRFSSVRHIAELFDRYALHRPEMLRAWAAGDDVDGSGAALGEDSLWQAQLWRRLRDRLEQPSPAERLEGACDRLRGEPLLLDLPMRFSLFGLTRVPRSRLQVLRALADNRDVHLFLLHPSPALWEAIAAATGPSAPVVRRHGDRTVDLAQNRLLASWGQDAREMQLVLTDPAAVFHRHPVEHQSDTLLARIQADIRENRAPKGPPVSGSDDARPPLDDSDASLRIHACHGRARQVEVVRDAILHGLQEDLTLEPRDVIVMCPDIETFAPLIHATFGAGEAPEGEQFETLPADVRPVDLKVRLADRALRQTNPILGVVAQLIDLASERMTASQLLDLADREPVRRRFRFDDDDLTRLQDWIAESGIRWALDAAHRAPFKLSRLPAGTWRFGLDRVLVGVTMTEDEQRLFAGVLPLDDVESAAIDLAGRFAEFVERVGAAVDAFTNRKSIDQWADAIATAADSLTAATDRDAWQRSELQRLLDDVVAGATVEGDINPIEIELPELRGLLAGRLQGRPTRANFRTGHLTICTLVPMRSVPHRVVCLLGLDDGVFPRKGPRDGDDLMLDDPHLGDRDGRIEDRQLLLDALLAAQDRLIVTYTGNDERTNTPRPPAVPVGELLDVIDATVRVETGAARERVLIRHPLQPFDPRNFEDGRLMPTRTWSFDKVTLDGARALVGPREESGTFLSDPLPPAISDLVEVEDLVRFAQHPVRAFLRQRLGISVADYFEEIEDDLPVELDGLGKWAVGQRLVDAQLAGVDGRAAILAEIARGSLPPGVLGQPVVNSVFPICEQIVQAADAVLEMDASTGSIDVRVLVDGRSLTGTVPGVAGDLVRTVTYSRLSAKHRVAAWVRLLALTAAHPERPFVAATVGRASGDATVAVARIGPFGDDATSRRATALGYLATLLDLYDRGRREPLPLYCLASAAYAEAAAAGVDPVPAARKAWTSKWNFSKEDKEPEHQLVLGGIRTLDELLQEPPRADEEGEGWEVTETTRVGRLARRMWDGVLSCEEIELR
jgi:exodeoxyribonuclease V gamma subunit